MQLATCRLLFRLVLFSAVLLIPGPALATSEAKDCPAEPTLNVPLISGRVFAGPKCVISPVLDTDSFQFNANKGDTYRILALMDGETAPKDVCFDVSDPNHTKIATGCSWSAEGYYSTKLDLSLTVTGTYTVVVYEKNNDATLKYQLSLERLWPFPADASPFSITNPPTTVSDEINPQADSDAFTFNGATTGTYRIFASVPSGSSDVCVSLYRPDGTMANSQCTWAAQGYLTIQMDTTPSESGTHLLVLYENGYDSTVSYNLTLSCLSGTCPASTPCTLKDTPSYDAGTGTLTMNFTIGHQYPVTWNGWVTYQNTMQSLWSESRAKTDPPVVVTKTASLSKVGKAGIISTLSKAQTGITCSSWTMVNTGTP